MINKKFTFESGLKNNEKVAFLALPIIGLLILIFIYFHNPLGNTIFPKCIFLRLTGFYCPGCGVTRATYYLVHGNILEAFNYNQLYILFLPFMLYLYILNLDIKINGKELLKTPKFNLLFYILVGSTFIIFCVLRNVPYYPFTILAP